MKLSLRAQLIVVALLLVGLALGAAFALLRLKARDVLEAQVARELLARAELSAGQITRAQAASLSQPELDQLAQELGRASRAQVLLLARDGRVMVDSGAPSGAPPALGSLAAQPDVAQALTGRSGLTGSASEHRGASRLFVSAPVSGQPIAVVRLGLQTDDVERGLASLQQSLWLAALVALALTVGLSSLVARSLTQTPSHLTEVARAMADGDLSVRARVPKGNQLAPLGAVLDLLATNLSTSLAELTSERDKMSSILESMREGVMLLDTEGRIRHLNPALRDMLWVQSDVVGSTLLEAVRQSELHALLALARRKNEAQRGEIEMRGLKPRVLLVQVQPVPEQGWLLVFFDVTEMRRLEGMRRDFVANVSHELRTPVASIHSAAETLMSGAKDNPNAAQRFIDIIDRNAIRLRDLVEDLLSLSSIESGAFRLHREDLELRPFLQQHLKMFEERARARHISLELSVPQELPPLDVDSRALEHVVSNLIDNALKYTREGDRVEISGRQLGGSVELRVADSGPGIAPEHLSRVFERFYRVDKGRSRGVGGTGLGLSIVKHLVEAHGGSVGVESELGQGAAFWVRLPAGRAAPLA